MKKIWLISAGCILAVCLLLSCTKNKVDREKEIFQAEKYRELGELLFKEAKYTAALKEFLKAEALNPDDHFLQNDLGLVFMYKRKPDLAIPRFKKALELKKDYSPARNNLGMAYYEKKDYARSEKNFLESLQLEKDFFMALYGLGKTYMAMNRVPEAIKRLERAAEIAPFEPRVYYELGKAYSLNREYQKGYDAYQEVVKLDAGSDLADKARLAAQKIKHLL